MSKIFVTGGTGFIGEHVVRLLHANKHSITCSIRAESNTSAIASRVDRFVPVDLMDCGALANALVGHDLVINLAGLTCGTRAELREVNVAAVENVAAACAQQPKPPVLIHVSSLAAAGPSDGVEARIESHPNHPVSHYGDSKLEGEKAIVKYANSVPISIIRPGIVLGEGDKVGLEFFRGVAVANWMIIPSFRNDIFSIIHAADLAKAIYLIWRSGERVSGNPTSGYYLAAATEEWSLAELGRQIGGVMGKRFVFPFYNARTTIRIAGWVCDLISKITGRKFAITVDKAREATSGAWHCNPQKLLNLGFRPEDLSTRLRQTFDWYVEHDFLKPTRQSNHAATNPDLEGF